MRVLCWCGEDFSSESTIAQCPKCFAVASLPNVSDLAAREMERDVRALIAAHENPIKPDKAR